MTQLLPITTRSDTNNTQVIFEKVWRGSYNKFLGQAMRLAQGNHALAESLVSRTTVRVMEYVRKTKRPIENLEAFFAVSLRNTANDHWRYYHRKTRGLEALGNHMNQAQGNDQTVNHVIAREELHQIASALSDLPQDHAELVRLRLLEHRPYSELASCFGVSEALARKRVQCARQKLRTAIAVKKSTQERHNTPCAASNKRNHYHSSGGTYEQ